ncbi:MAG: substrate-binding domain-containing protein [Bacteroidetes bacterium]|nr:substrate-binding domain-containing protein [Bacteroidota bacterium]
MKNISVRIKDIAEKAGVSAGTVDRVLHKRGKVAPDVESRVLQILKELNYEPNLIARALGSNKTYRIAALIPDPAFDPYWQAPKEGVEAAHLSLKQYGIHIAQYLFNPYDVNSYIDKAKELTRLHPDGIFLSPIFHRETTPFFRQWQEMHIPYVLFNTHITEANALCYVGQDSYQSGLLAGRLIHYGQSGPCSVLVAHIDEDITNAAHLLEKEQGFRDYINQNAGTDEFTIVVISLNRSDPRGFDDTLKQAFARYTDLSSIYVTTSRAYDIVAWLEREGIKNLKLVGYDLLPQNVEYLNKGRISFLINQNPRGQGYYGIHRLADHLVFKKQAAGLKYLPLDVVTKENAMYYTSPEFNGSAI